MARVCRRERALRTLWRWPGLERAVLKRALLAWAAVALVLLAAELRWTDWGFKTENRCYEEAVERLGAERIAGYGPAEVRRWPPGFRCHVNDCPGWEERDDPVTHACQVGSSNRTIEFANGPLDWAWLLSVALFGAGALVGPVILVFVVRRSRHSSVPEHHP